MLYQYKYLMKFMSKTYCLRTLFLPLKRRRREAALASAGFCSDISTDDEGYFDALVRMFEQTLKFADALSVDRGRELLIRLDRVRTISHQPGYGVGDDMDFLLSKYTRGIATHDPCELLVNSYPGFANWPKTHELPTGS
jgi:hypothetical protein